MNRLQKKCFIASTGTHLLLALVLFVGPAFIAPKPKADDLPVLDFIALKTTDEKKSGGGRPDGRLPSAPPPAAKPPAPAPAPPPPQRAPDPVKPVEQARSEPDPSFEPAQNVKPKKFVLTPIKHQSSSNDEKQKKLAAQQEERERQRWTDSVRRTADAFSQAANEIADSTTSSTSVALKGPGGGGVPYANFLQAVKSRYANAWIVPDGITDDDATVSVSVTIARGGDVVSSRITRSSGNAAVDRSVQVTLDRVRWVAPLPEGATENTRTVTIDFNVRAKRALG